MKYISTHSFKHTLRDIQCNTENRKFCFVLGAGASRKSGIPTGGELSIKWFKELEVRLSMKVLNEWVEKEKINKSDLALSYGKIYRKRFENDKASGYEFLVNALKSAKPSYGHIVLAQILSRTDGNCVLTTNFDSLVESSIYQYTNKTPLVCGHESLSGYARPSKSHPLIIKIHRDLLLEPKSDPEEINILDNGWNQPLDHIFSTHIPIVIGYGGNDGSLMKYFESMNKPSNFFWCCTDTTNISQRIYNLIDNHDGCFVTIDGFDELMHKLLFVFDEVQQIDKDLKEITDRRIQFFAQQYKTVKKPIFTSDNIVILSKSEPDEGMELSAYEFKDLADKEPDFDKRKSIYLEALNKYPSTGWLWWNFTYFLDFEKKEYSELDSFYQDGLEYNKNESGYIENYACFLSEVKKDYQSANEYFIKALSIDSKNASINGNYGIFLYEKMRDYIRAEEYYLKAIEIEPENANFKNNYANLLHYGKKDYPKAEEYYLKALAIEPDQHIFNLNFALFQTYIKKDYAKAEEYYLKAFTIKPNDANITGLYALYLHHQRKELAQAEEFYLKALAYDPKHRNNNGNYAQFLLEKGMIIESHEYVNRAFMPNEGIYRDISNEEYNNNSLLLELWFYRYAHFHEFMEEAQTKIEDLLSKGIRSKGWDFSGNIEKAIEMGHPNPDKLKELAKRITST